MSETVTTDMIDPVLADRIFKGISKDDISTLSHRILQVLAWLTNNPVSPTDDQIRRFLSKRWGISPQDIAPNMVISGLATTAEWNKIRFLKKEEPLPEELKELFAEEIQYPGIPLSISRDQYNRDLVAAWKIGKKSK